MITAHPLPGRVTHHETAKLQKAINAAPLYSGKAASALKHVIEVIHGLPAMHSALKLKDIEVYIGKAERTTKAVLNRWGDHRSHRKHIFGIILFRCSLDNAKKLEKLSIRVVKALKARNSLCVGDANLSSGSGGKNPASNDALIYMTWAPLATPTGYSKPTQSIICDVAKAVAPSMNGVVKEAQILCGLRAIKRLSSFKKIRMDHY